MAAPGFGFSFGDIVTAVNILNDVRKALRDTGGARDELSKVQTELEQLGILLVHLNHGHWDHGGNAGLLNAIKGMASTCRLPLQDFLAKIEKYKALQTKELGFRNGLSRQAKKIHWAINMDEEVERFRAVMAGKLTSVQLLISTHIISTTTQIDARSKAILRTTLESRRGIQECQEQVRDMHDTMQKNITDVRTSTGGLDRLVQICAGIKVGVEDFRRLGQARHVETDRRLKRLQRDQYRGLTLIFSQIGVHTSRVSSLTELVTQLLRRFGGFTSTAAEFFKQSLNNDLNLFTLLRDIHRIIQRQPVSAREDLFHFTDGLGRSRPLPYDIFRNFNMVELMLKNDFRERPGERLVVQGQYHLLKGSRTQDLIIDKNKWERSIVPGTQIVMSMIIDDLLFEEGVCPRPACRARNLVPSKGSNIVICSGCQLEYRYEQVLTSSLEIEENPKPSGLGILQMATDNVLQMETLSTQPNSERESYAMKGTLPGTDRMLVEEELEAFRSIHIQTNSGSKSLQDTNVQARASLWDVYVPWDDPSSKQSSFLTESCTLRLDLRPDSGCEMSNWVAERIVERLCARTYPTSQVAEFVGFNGQRIYSSSQTILAFQPKNSGQAERAIFFVASGKGFPFEMVLGARDCLRFGYRI